MLTDLLQLDIFRFFLVFTRIGSALMLFPGLGGSLVSTRIRLLLALSISFVMAPAVSSVLPGVPPSIGGMVLAVFGEAVVGMRKAGIFALRRRMGMLFQNGALLTDLSVFENVAFPLREHTDLPEPLVRQLVLTKLHAVGLRGAASLMPGELSGGMARRVALARAIVMDPELLIYDEPFVGLDPISMGVIVRLIRQMNEALGITSIVVSHDVDELSLIAHRSYLISEGRVVASGSPEELRNSPQEVVRQFIGGHPDGPVPFHYPAPDYFDELLGRGKP